MAVNSKADKTGGHKAQSVGSQGQVKGDSTPLKAKSYSAAPAASGMVPSGQKALLFRARKELAPLADPTQALA